MNTLQKLWKNISTNLHFWLFQCFLISFPLSIRKVLYYYPIDGQFNEYSGMYLYLSDVFLILTIGAWILSILCNRKHELSTTKLPPFAIKFLIALATLTSWSFLSALWADNVPVAIFRSMKLFEWLLLGLYILSIVPRGTIDARDKNVPRGTFFTHTMQTLTIIGVAESILGISQFILQRSIGLSWLRESIIANEIPGVAKIIFDGEKYIRAYGTFPHPNILAGFLTFSIITTFLYMKHKLFHVEQFNNSNDVPRGTIKNWLELATIIQTLALILTFSKSAILGLLLGIAIIYSKQILFKICYIRIVPRGTIYFLKNISITKKAFFFTAMLLAILVLSKLDSTALITQPLKERLFYINVSRGTILNNPIIGSGAGQFVLNMANYSQKLLMPWEYQPVHNVLLLIWSELGLVGLILFTYLISLPLLKIVPRGTKNAYSSKSSFQITNPNCSTWNNWNSSNEAFPSSRIVPRGTICESFIKIAFISQIFILLFDHYHWDIQQGQITFWILLVLTLQAKNHFANCSTWNKK